MYSSVHSQRDDDARVADAHRFVTEVEDMMARAGAVAPRLDRIDGPDRTGTAYAVVDPLGRFVDLGLEPGWWRALGPAGVADGLLEALDGARMKAALFSLMLRRHGFPPAPPASEEPPPQPPASEEPPPLPPAAQEPPALPSYGDGSFLDAARGRIADAYRLIDDADRRLCEFGASRVVRGPRGLFRLHVRGGQIDRAEVEQSGLAPHDTDRLVADARDAFTELARSHGAGSVAWGDC